MKTAVRRTVLTGRPRNSISVIRRATFKSKYFKDRLRDWWKEHKRDLPWRGERDPYRILIAEILLRRTQAKQVVPIYVEFLRLFPEPAILAAASPDHVRATLWPLGLHWRTEDVIRLGKEMLAKTGGTVPDAQEEIRSLPGVGDYVTAAVRCFAWGEPVPVIDTNTARVVARFFGISSKGELRRNRDVRELLDCLVHRRRPREFNWALIDFAHDVCRARIPLCSACPVAPACSKTGVVQWR